jgi:hypothetical protein
MRLEVESGPGGVRLIVALSEIEGKELNAGLEPESRAWQTSFRDRIREAHLLDAVQQFEKTLEASRRELEELLQGEEKLRDERRRLLESGSNINGIEKRLATTRSNCVLVRERCRELESLVATRTSLAASEISESHGELMAELYATQEQQRTELEQAFLSVAGDLIKKLVRHRKLSEMRGHSLQAFRRRVTEGQSSELIRPMLDTAST